MNKSAVKIWVLALVTSLTLAGCTAETGDGRAGDGFASPLKEVSEHLSSGDGKALCIHLNEISPGSCDSIVSSSGTETSVKPLAQFTASGEVFIFEKSGFKLALLRDDIDIDGEVEQVWSVGEFAPESISLPLGGSMAGVTLSPGQDYKVMPGNLDVSEFQLFEDQDGIWMSDLNPSERRNAFVAYSPSVLSSDIAESLLLDACNARASSLDLSELLNERYSGSGNRQYIQFSNTQGQTLDSRNLRSPAIAASRECRLGELSFDFPYVIATALVDLSISAAVERRTGWSGGLPTREYLPNVFTGSVSLELLIQTQNTGVNSVVIEPVGLPEYWLPEVPVLAEKR
jgi:hypothetical protein